MVFPKLETERLKLVPLKEKHAEDVLSLFSHPAVLQYYNLEALDSIEAAASLILWLEEGWARQQRIRWGLVRKKDRQRRIIGTCGYNHFTPRHRANLSYDLHPDFWRQGYMSEALPQVIFYGFAGLQANRVEAEVLTGNKPSQQLLRHLGFRCEALLRDWLLWKEEYHDMWMFRLLREEAMEYLGKD